MLGPRYCPIWATSGSWAIFPQYMDPNFEARSTVKHDILATGNYNELVAI